MARPGTVPIDGRIRLWSLPDGARLAMLRAHPGNLTALALSRDGTTLITGSSHGEVRLWKFPSLESTATIRDAHKGSSVRAIAISPQGKLFVTAGYPGTVKLWRLPEASFVRSVAGAWIATFALAFAPDGTALLAAAEDRTIRFLDLNTGRVKGCLVDLKANPASAKGATYRRKNQHGHVITWTQPCGSPIPPGAVCTCNCVPGSIPLPKKPKPPPPPSKGGTGGGTLTQPCGTPIPPGYYCTCNCIG